MESTHPETQLESVERLRAATRTEASRTPRWATVTMVAGVFVFFAAFGAAPEDARVPLYIGWLVFVASWAVLLRWGRRAHPAHEPLTKRAILEWISLVVLANLITFGLGRVSWALVGVLLALLGAGWGGLLARRERRA